MPIGILFLLVLILVVVVHEAGHFFAAKQVGMRVKEFAFGFPPKLFSKTKGETTYSFNAIPLGGYVAIDGENGANDINDPRLFTNKSKLAQAWVLFAGPMMNIVLAFVLMSISFMVGYGDNNSQNQVVILNTLPNSAAEISGIKPGDKIYAINLKETSVVLPNVEQIRSIIKNSNGDELTITLDRQGNTQIVKLNPLEENNEYKIGVSMGLLESKKLGFFASIKEGLITSLRMTRDTAVGFIKIIGSIFTGSDIKASLTGPVGIAKEVGVASSFGFAYLLSFIALISVNLGVLNMFPFPALDGGRLLFLGIERIKGSKIKPSVANVVNTIGFGLLMLLMIVITVKDVIKLF